jgi:hypothetical protein
VRVSPSPSPNQTIQSRPYYPDLKHALFPSLADVRSFLEKLSLDLSEQAAEISAVLLPVLLSGKQDQMEQARGAYAGTCPGGNRPGDTVVLVLTPPCLFPQPSWPTSPLHRQRAASWTRSATASRARAVPRCDEPPTPTPTPWSRPRFMPVTLVQVAQWESRQAVYVVVGSTASAPLPSTHMPWPMAPHTLRHYGRPDSLHPFLLAATGQARAKISWQPTW